MGVLLSTPVTLENQVAVGFWHALSQFWLMCQLYPFLLHSDQLTMVNTLVISDWIIVCLQAVLAEFLVVAASAEYSS